MAPIKQVILIRKDLKMRRGKEIAQGSHAAMAFLVERIRAGGAPQSAVVADGININIALSVQELDWLAHGMAKVCLQVTGEAQLLAYHEQARTAGLHSHLIIDSGRTEFGGVPTATACAIGPDLVAKIDTITGALSLY